MRGFPRRRFAARGGVDSVRALGGGGAEARGGDYGWQREVGKDETDALIGGSRGGRADAEDAGEAVQQPGDKGFSRSKPLLLH